MAATLPRRVNIAAGTSAPVQSTGRSSPAQLDAAVSAVYSAAKGGNLLSLSYFWLNEYQSDDCTLGGGQTEVHYVTILNGTYDATNDVMGGVWNGWYRMIHRANVVIEKAPGVQKIDETIRKQRVAEAKFLRAWAYYELVVNWGKVPIYTEIVERLGGFQPRAEIADVYAQIYKDLAASESSFNSAI